MCTYAVYYKYINLHSLEGMIIQLTSYIVNCAKIFNNWVLLLYGRNIADMV